MHSTVVWLAIQVVVIACISVGVHAVVWLALTIHCSGLAYNTSLQRSGLQYQMMLTGCAAVQVTRRAKVARRFLDVQVKDRSTWPSRLNMVMLPYTSNQASLQQRNFKNGVRREPGNKTSSRTARECMVECGVYLWLTKRGIATLLQSVPEYSRAMEEYGKKHHRVLELRLMQQLE